jgi:hypothetical protein
MKSERARISTRLGSRKKPRKITYITLHYIQLFRPFECFFLQDNLLEFVYVTEERFYILRVALGGDFMFRL